MSEQEKQPDNQTTQPVKKKRPAVKFYVSEVRSFLSLF